MYCVLGKLTNKKFRLVETGVDIGRQYHLGKEKLNIQEGSGISGSAIEYMYM